MTTIKVGSFWGKEDETETFSLLLSEFESTLLIKKLAEALCARTYNGQSREVEIRLNFSGYRVEKSTQ